MFDIGWSELLLIGVVALIIVGPKDLPGMFRTLGRFTAKAKNMAREFQRAMDDAADEAGMKDAANDLKNLTNPKKMGLDAVKDAAEKFEKWQPKIPSASKGPATAELTAERAETAKKIHDAAAKKASDRLAAEEAAKSVPAAAAKPAPAKKTAAKPAAAKKPAAKAAAAKPAAKKPAARKPAAKAGTAKPAAKARKPAQSTASGKSDA